ncbi:MAG: single-stranded-DNA-specific exonuclease RecJ, partial [Coriobacteriales bacterium]|nr:single-stranded-DNA-specific exonuclease RecJ [Coriobacteriales bacterium]
MSTRWIIGAVDEVVAAELARACAITPLLARTLVARGLSSPQEVDRFLHPDLDRDWSDPALIFGMEQAADALAASVRAGRRVLVFGDFDVDGVSATACLAKGLASLGADVDCLLPNRAKEGYGLSPASLERIYERQPETVVTVDCGISSRDEVACLRARGIEVIVTDHHEPSGSVPVDVPVANPKLDADSPLSILAGAGVALKLVAALGARLGQPELWRSLVDLAALGTVADVMPLTGENRSLVAAGITQIKQHPRPGVAAALALSRHKEGPLNATDLSFGIIPRLNAAGRMGDASVALDLLLCEDALTAADVAATLDAMNKERRAVEADLLARALAQAEAARHGQNIVIVAGEGWHEGVRGIVASRLVSRFGLPAIVFTLDGDEARGSGRSVGALNLFKAVQGCEDLTLRFGGHEAAVGLTLPSNRLKEFSERMEAILAEATDEELRPPTHADVQVSFDELDLESVEQLSLLEPHGHSNRAPLYVSRNLRIRRARAVGAEKNHLSLTLACGSQSHAAIWFRCPCIDQLIGNEGSFDVLYKPRVDEYNGRRSVKLAIEQIREAQDEGPSANNDRGDSRAASAPGAPAYARADRGEGRAAPAPPLPALSGSEDVAALASQIVGAPISLHPAQSEALEALGRGESVLVVMATGRGKSLIFQTHAARLARERKLASVFIYPLRALIADQAAHLSEGFARLGLRAHALTGENRTQEKDRAFQDLYEGSTDVVLTTPEFFGLHAWRFAACGRIGFITFDEAHHIGTERSAGRSAYRDLAYLRAQLGDVQCLAVTATSDGRTTGAIKEALGIGTVVVDDARRENLHVRDLRGHGGRDEELVRLGARARRGKLVIYVGSRMQAVALARLLRKHETRTPSSVAFYHAGLSRAQRRAVEAAFKHGETSILVSTSAFGEGVNLPDISDVVLYGLPFSAAALNQMSGRAGRDGGEATIHLLYTQDDLLMNRRLLAPLAPGREEMAEFYRMLRDRAPATPYAAASAEPASAALAASAAAPTPEAASSATPAVASATPPPPPAPASPPPAGGPPPRP